MAVGQLNSSIRFTQFFFLSLYGKKLGYQPKARSALTALKKEITSEMIPPNKRRTILEGMAPYSQKPLNGANSTASLPIIL
jgi:hypothetical protein